MDAPALSYNFTAGLLQGTITSWVVKNDGNNTLGGLDFVYQVKLTSGDLSQLSLNGFNSLSSVNVSDTPGGVFSFLPGSVASTAGNPAATQADWSSNLHFTWDPTALASGTTDLLVVDTASSQFGINTFSGVEDGGGADVSVYAVPEPTTILAGALLLLPFGASTLRFARKSRVA